MFEPGSKSQVSVTAKLEENNYPMSYYGHKRSLLVSCSVSVVVIQ